MGIRSPSDSGQATWTPLARLGLALTVVATLLVSMTGFGDRRLAMPRAEAQNAWSFPDWPALPHGTAGLTRPRVLVDSGGGLHVAWTGPDAFGRDTVWLAERSAGSGWQAPEPVWSSPAGQSGRDAELAIDSRGRLHLAWTASGADRVGILHAKRGIDGRWTSPEPLGLNWSFFTQEAVSLAADPWGNLLLGWTDYRRPGPAIAWARALPSGQWLPAGALPFGGTGDQHAIRLAVMANGWTYAVWQDSREGSGAIYSSALPPGGDTWWPAAKLSHVGQRRQRSPAVAADGAGNVLAAWIDEGLPHDDSDAGQDAIRAAVLVAGEPFWSADREVYRAQRGPIASLDLAGGAAPPGGLSTAVIAWSEARPQGSRVYAATWAAGTTLNPLRVDNFAVTTDGEGPALAVDGDGRAHVVWLARSPLGEGVGVAHATLEPSVPLTISATAEGWLAYTPSAANCAGSGYTVTDCEGNASQFLTGRAEDLDPLLGQYVSVSGLPRVVGGCRLLRAERVRLHPVPCARQTGAVVGRLTVGDTAPAVGASVAMGGEAVGTGDDGRFFVDGLAEGRYTITATLACAVTAVITDVQVRARDLTIVDAGVLRLGDVAPNDAVDFDDLLHLAVRLRQPPHDTEPCADLDADGIVSHFDMNILRASYGLVGPQPWRRPESAGP